jgi:hypothetical protein
MLIKYPLIKDKLRFSMLHGVANSSGEANGEEDAGSEALHRLHIVTAFVWRS